MSPATRKRPARPSFYEVILEGSPKMSCGFLNGLMMGAELEGAIFYCHDEGVDFESFSDRLAELVRLHPRDTHVIVDAVTHGYLKKLAPRMEQTLGLLMLTSRHIRSAELPFCFEAFAERYGREIVHLLDNLPSGLRLVDFKTKEKRAPEAAGVEAYAVAHDYELRGKGKIKGRIDLVIQARRDLDAHPLIEVDKIKLSTT